MKKILLFLSRLFYTFAFGNFVYGGVVFRFLNPELTETQLFLCVWPFWIAGIIMALLALSLWLKS